MEQELSLITPKSDNENLPLGLTEDQLPKLNNSRQANFIAYVLAGYSLTNAYKNAGYTSEEHDAKAAWQIANTDPVKTHLEWHRVSTARRISPEWILSKYAKLITDAMNEDKSTYNPAVAIEGLKELNKMQGNYAPEKVNVSNVNATLDDIRRVMGEYKKEY